MLRTDTLQITPELLVLLSEIDEFKGAWRALGRLAPERLKALRRVATIESVGSSTRIEGGKLTDREVERLLTNLEIKKFESRDEQEVAGYAAVMETIFAAWQEIPINENYIKQLHRDLLRYSEKDEWHRGEYKKMSNSVATFDESGKQIGILFETALRHTAPYGRACCLATRSPPSAPTTSLADRRCVHCRIFGIYPFQDGNGRLSRFLNTLRLLQFSYAYVPYSSFESVIENSKKYPVSAWISHVSKSRDDVAFVVEMFIDYGGVDEQL